jgi:ATP-dependent NAD(P)H-hydrate dehydratase
LSKVESIDMISRHFSRLDVLVIGPGLGRRTDTLNNVSSLLACARASSLPIILDADALLLVQPNLSVLTNYPNCILTPNHYEYGRLCMALGLNEEEVGRTLLSKRQQPRIWHLD